MANIKNLKKNINYVLGDIIQVVYLHEMSTAGKPTPETTSIIDEAIVAFDNLMSKVNQKGIENKKAHFKSINSELENIANELVAKLNNL